MKKYLLILMVAFVFLVGCQTKSTQQNSENKNEKTENKTETKDVEKKDTEKKETKELEVIKVASHTKPMTTILELIADDLESRGYKLELVPVTDNVQANVIVNNKEADANFFQHEPFMQQFNKGNNAKLVKITPVYNALVSFYSDKLKSIEEVKDNAVVAIPQDPTNMARALRLLAKTGLIELDNKDSYEVTLENIKSNPKNLQIKAWGLLNLNEAYKESDLTFNYPTYIESLGLKPLENGLVLEDEGDQTFAISLVAREDNKDDEKIKVLSELINSEEVKKFIEENLKGHAVVSFK